MNPFLFNYQSDFTQFTAALLKDTMFYKDVNENLVEFSAWGLNKGCSFIKDNCESPLIEFEEFNYSYDSREYDCDVNGHGKNYLPSSQVNMDNCATLVIDEKEYCTQLNRHPILHTQEIF